MPYVNVVGNLSTGFSVIGPFDFGGDAFDAGDEMKPNDTQWVMELDMTHPDKWANPLIQFARLIAEIEAAGGFTKELILALRASMDLRERDLLELIERAQDMFDNIKENA